MNTTSRFNTKLPSSITYHIINAFPSSIVAAPLAYGRAELIKTTITFNYEQYFTQRASRKGSVLAESDGSEENIRDPDYVIDSLQELPKIINHINSVN